MAATALPRSDPERPGGGRVAVATLAIGAKARRVFALAQPLMATYAQRIGAEFVVIEDLPPGRSPQASKCELAGLLARFERVVYLDCDLLVHPDCPDLTALVPEAMLGALVESRIGPRQHAVDAVVARLGAVGWDDGAYFNSGVMVLSDLHRDVLEELGEHLGSLHRRDV